MEQKEVKKYVNKIIPSLERELVLEKRTDKLHELYTIYRSLLCAVAPYDFISFNKYLELDEDHSQPTKAFYYHRKHHLHEIFQAFNDMEIYDKYDLLLISTPPRIGKTTIGIRFLSWIAGRHPENTQLATSYSDAITQSFYIGVMEIITSKAFQDVFPEAKLINQNAKREEIWLKLNKRYPTLTFVSITGSMTGRAEAGNYLYCDDLVSGAEEAFSRERLEKLWQLYTVNAKQRKKNDAKEVHIATRWSVHDPITRLSIENEDNPRAKIITMPWYNEKGQSRFNFIGGFNTAYYKELEKSMDKVFFRALYCCDPIEREGILYNEDDLSYYFELPNEPPDTIISVVDSKNLGKDYVSAPIGYVYGDTVYIEDWVYNNGLPEITRPLVANKWLEHKVVRGDVEMNNGGNYYAEELNKIIKENNGKTSIRIFFTGNNKNTKIVTYSDYVKKRFVFKHKSTYSENSEYAKAMKDLTSWVQFGKNKNDDAPDSMAMLAQLHQELEGSSVKIIDRRTLGI